MAQPDRFNPWLALAALAFFGLTLRLTLWPLPFATPQPQVATRPPVHYYLPPAPAWPVGHHAFAPNSLSLASVAG